MPLTAPPRAAPRPLGTAGRDCGRPLRVLITTPSYPPATGGVARVAERQAEHLARRGHRVTVITADEAPDDAAARPAADGVQVIRVPVRPEVSLTDEPWL